MRTRMWLGGYGLGLLLAACGDGDTTQGSVDALLDTSGDALEVTGDDIVGDVDASDDTLPDAATDATTDDASGDTTGDSVDATVADSADDTTVTSDATNDVGDDTADTTVADTGPDGDDTSAAVCGNGLVEDPEPCDDGDECAADGCAQCVLEPALVVTELALDETVGWDLDDKDGDGDATTGIDNRLGGSGTVRIALDSILSNALADGSLIPLAALGGVSSLAGDDDVTVSLFEGADPGCGAVSPPPWRDDEAAPAALWRAPDAFEQCLAPSSIDDSDDSANGIRSDTVAGSPAPPWLRAWAASVVLPAGPLGDLTIARAHLEGHLVVGADGALRGLDDGRLGGIVPARALFHIGTADTTPLCPTALHLVLGFAGHIDQDNEGNGKLDFIQWTTSAGIPCVTAPVVIVGCCDDGDCQNRIDGADCPDDARIGDGFSAGFRASANAVHVIATEPADACAP